MTLRERLRGRRKGLDLTQAELARRLEIDQSTVAKWETGPNAPRTAIMKRLADVLDVSIAWLVAGDETGTPPEPVMRTEARGEKDLPVLSTTSGEDEADFKIGAEVHEYVERPTRFVSVGNAYAVYVHGNRMEPRYYEGEVVFVNPNRPVTPGCFVVVQLEGEPRGLVGRLVKRTSKTLMIERLNPVELVELPPEDVRSCDRIILAGEP